MDKLHRLASLAFVFAVTTFLLASVFLEAARGPAGIPGTVVYAFAAGFGLEFLGAAWTGRFGRRGHSQVQS